MKQKLLSIFQTYAAFLKKRKCAGCREIRTLNYYGFCVECEKKIIFYKSSENKHWHILKYEGPVKTAICDFKFRGLFYHGRKFARLAAVFIEENKVPAFDVIIPVPLNLKKEFKRGFNQSAVISSHLARILKKKMLQGVLLKVRNTVPQTNLNGKERQQNIRGSFNIRKKQLIEKKKILLVDDVYTTGATTDEARKILKQNGAKQVIVLTIARA
jgi:competence protein ComFC